MSKHIDVDYDKCFELIPQITKLPFKRKGDKWYAKCSINGSEHERWDKLVALRDSTNGIVILEQGGDRMQLYKWLQAYGGCRDGREAYHVLKEQSSCDIVVPHPPPPPPPLKFVYSTVMYRDIRNIGTVKDNLFLWLVSMFSYESVVRAYKLYNTAPFELKNGKLATSFWYVGINGSICHDKIMAYKEDGHRDKAIYPIRRFKSDAGFRGKAFFGEHLIPQANQLAVSNPDKVYVVESEKTALMMFLTYNRLCIATGGSNCDSNIKPEWILLPDYDDAGQRWLDKYPSQCVKWWDYYPFAKNGWDMGDVIEYNIKKLTL